MVRLAKLHNLTILITRPELQATNLAEQITHLGGTPILLPCIEITEPEDKQSLVQAISTLTKFDIAIFISPTAVEKTIPLLKSRWSTLPPRLKIGCIGEGTAQALNRHQITVDFYPKARFNSEELLALPELHCVSDKRIVLFKGEGGNPLLADALQQRGAHVHIAIAYKRSCPQIDISSLITRWVTAGIDVVISTSQEALTNLTHLLGQQYEKLLLNTPLLVISPNMEQLAKQQRFNTILLADNATDEAIVAKLIQHREQVNDKANT